MSRYSFYTTHNKVICVSHYAGKAVRGVAKCAPNDTFNLETGKELARLRCDEKVTRARLRNAKVLFKEAQDNFDRAEKLLDKRYDFLTDAEDEAYAIEERLGKLEDVL